MLITGINFFQDKWHPSFEAVRIRQINPVYYNFQRTFESELDGFVKYGDNVETAGKGLSAVVYKFKLLPDFVFKKSTKGKTDFSDEIFNLRSIPSYIKNVQKFVAQAFDDDTGLFYLVSTRMKGKSPDGQKAVWTDKHLKSLFDTLLELDRNGIYHGDINAGNILLDEEGKANLIDFQWMQKIDKNDFFKNKIKSVLPPFIMPENSQMLEMAAIPYYLQRCQNGKEFLKTYLIQKAAYHKNRYNLARNMYFQWNNLSDIKIISKSMDFEMAQAKTLIRPDEDVLKVETKKIQFLSAFRDAYSRLEQGNPDGNFPTSGSAYLLVMSHIKDLRNEIANIIGHCVKGSHKEDYLKFTDEYAKYWFDNVSSWIDDIFDYSIRRAVSAGTSKETVPEKFGVIYNIARYVDESYLPQYSRGFNVQYGTTTDKILKNIKESIGRLRNYSSEIWYDPSYNKKLKEIIDVNEKLEKAYNSKFALDIINLSVLDIVRNRELKEIIAPKTYLSNRNNIITELHNLRLMHEDIARQNYKLVLSDIKWTDKPVGYKNMNNLD